MDLSQAGGEFSLLDRILRPQSAPGLVVGTGDDCAVFELGGPGGDRYLLATTDMLVEGDHFRLDWYTPRQVGRKCVEANVSDTAAMGGWATFMLVSICLRPDTSVECVDGIYEGLYEGCRHHNVALVGGDTTHGPNMVINITILGEVERERLVLRKGARPGDGVFVSGPTGGSAAGLAMLLKGRREFIEDHLNPRCRPDAGRTAGGLARAMIDVSDGVASEARHIAKMSGTGVRLVKDLIPLDQSAVEAGRALGRDPYRWALSGGEDYELVAAADPADFARFEAMGWTRIGEFTAPDRGFVLEDGGGELPLPKGYDHFADNG